jgi:hypothetical protein
MHLGNDFPGILIAASLTPRLTQQEFPPFFQ